MRVPRVPGLPHLSRWGRLVAASATIVLACVLVLAGWGLASAERRVTSFSVVGTLSAISLDVDGADVEIVGGGNRAATVRRTDRFAFGHAATVRREVSNGALTIRSRCPRTPLQTCRADYQVTVPTNVPVAVRTGDGDVRLRAFEGSARVQTGDGDVDVRAFCGVLLEARAESGDVGAATVCAPERMVLRSRSGSIRAVAPPARYNVEADSDSGRAVVRGLRSAPDAPFLIQALSGSGDVLVEQRR